MSFTDTRKQRLVKLLAEAVEIAKTDQAACDEIYTIVSRQFENLKRCKGAHAMMGSINSENPEANVIDSIADTEPVPRTFQADTMALYQNNHTDTHPVDLETYITDASRQLGLEATAKGAAIASQAVDDDVEARVKAELQAMRQEEGVKALETRVEELEQKSEVIDKQEKVLAVVDDAGIGDKEGSNRTEENPW